MATHSKCFHSWCRLSFQHTDKVRSIFQHRKWVEMPVESVGPSRFTVSTYNLLSQHYIWPKVFDYVPKKYIDWNYRHKLIDQNISQLNADIMCFQEMEHDIYERHWCNNNHDNLLSPLADYVSVFARKPPPAYWNKKDQFMDGVGVFVKRSKFEILGSKMVNFAQEAEKDKENYLHTPDFIERVLKRNTVGVILALRHRSTGKLLFITNTHLYWSPKFEDVKLIQTVILMNTLMNYIKQFHSSSGLPYTADDAPVIMCGDFNSSTDSLVYKFLTNGEIDLSENDFFKKYSYKLTLQDLENKKASSEEKHKLTLPFHLKSAHRNLYRHGKFPFTTFTKRFKGVIDFVYYNDNVLQLDRDLGQVDPRYVAKHKGFPNKDFPSDHIPMCSEFEFLSAKGN